MQKPASLYELAICLGNRGVREGYLRPLRNLNPRVDADSWLPAGTVLNATTRIAGLYDRYCVQGPRAVLADQLVRANPSTAIVRIGAIQPVPMGAATTTPDSVQSPTVQTTPAEPAPVAPKPDAKPVAKAEPKKRKVPTHYAVQRGETLTSIAEKFQCDMRDLAKANAVKGPRYSIKPGQKLKLASCEG